MIVPRNCDCCAVWQAWVEDPHTKDERLKRYESVPEAYRTRVASHMRTVQAIEQYHINRAAQRGMNDASRVRAIAHRKVDRDNPYGG